MADKIFPTQIPDGTPAGDDRLLFSDTSAGNATKDCAVSELPISDATSTALGLKADKSITVNGQSISSNVVLDTDDVSEGLINLYDKTVSLLAGSGISVSGTYPNFTVSNSSPDQVVALTAGTNVTITGTYPNFTISASGGSGSGDVVGPASATDSAVALFDTTTGKLLKDSAKTIVTTLGSTDTTIPTSKAVKDVTDTKMSGNTAITGATKTKITYDSKGLVTSGDEATTADIADSTNKRYVTDAEKTSIGTIGDKINISETNSLVVHTMRSDNTWINYVNTTGAVQISLDGLFGAGTNFGGKMRLEIQSTSFTATLMIEGRYDAVSHTWTYGKATIETSSTSSINVRFARSASGVFLIVGDTTTAWAGAKFAIAEVLFNTPNALTGITFSTIGSYPADIDFLVTPALYATGGGTATGTNTGDETASTIGVLINGSTAATPNDTDLVATSDTSVLKKITWTNVKSFLKTYFDTVYANIAGSVTQAFSASTIELGHATDTTISRVSAGVIAVEGVNVIMNGGALGTPSSGTLSGCTVDGTNKVGYLNIPQNSQSAAYTTVLADAGKHIYHPSADTTARTITIDSNANVAYPIGTALTFVNDTSAGTLTIAITSDTLVLAGAGTTGSRTLAANGVATAIKVTSTRWIISGTNLT